MSITRKQSGFTILEIVIVFILLAGIMAFVGPKIFEQMERAKVKEAEIRLLSLANQIQLYQAETRNTLQLWTLCCNLREAACHLRSRTI